MSLCVCRESVKVPAQCDRSCRRPVKDVLDPCSNQRVLRRGHVNVNMIIITSLDKGKRHLREEKEHNERAQHQERRRGLMFCHSVFFA